MPDILETVRLDDFVEYFIYLNKDDESTPDRLQDIRRIIFSSYTPLIENYIWHKDEFSLSKVIDYTGSTYYYLYQYTIS